MQNAFIGKDQQRSFEIKESRPGEVLFNRRDRGVGGGDAADALTVIHKGFDQRAFYDKSALPVLNLLFINPFVVAEQGVPIYGNGKDGYWAYVGSLGSRGGLRDGGRIGHVTIHPD